MTGEHLVDMEESRRKLCRNVTIYGSCKFQGKGCAFVHDPKKMANSSATSGESTKKSFNVDSPSFTPSFLSAPSHTNGEARKAGGLSPRAASAAPFHPKPLPAPRTGTSTPEWTMDVQDFVPQSYNLTHLSNGVENNLGNNLPLEPFDPSSHPLPSQPTAGTLHSQPAVYQDGLAIAGNGFFPTSAGFQQPPQYHQYAPIGPFTSNVQSYQRSVHDLFIPNHLREEIQKRSAATLQAIPNLNLPSHVENYHSLVPLDTNQKSSTILAGYSSWVYKSQSAASGRFFALRRIEGFRLTDEKAIRTVQAWKSITSSGMVNVQDAFTTRSFKDSSLILVCDYHPMAKTLADHHFGSNKLLRGRSGPEPIPELVLWAYLTQIATAIKCIHSNALAARVIHPSKILVTGKNRIRLNGCAIMDVLQYDAQVPLEQLRRQDLVNMGLLLLSLGSNTLDVSQNFAKAMDQFKRHYGNELQDAVVWLYGSSQNPDRNIDQFLATISPRMTTAYDAALAATDEIHNQFSREVENGRLFRLMAKLGFINERPEYEHDGQWSEHGERYYLKLFRDYLFHQVDAQENPVVDLGHVLSCLNKLDVGSEERISLVSRDNQSCFIVTFRELKKGVESAFQDLLKNARRPL